MALHAESMNLCEYMPGGMYGVVLGINGMSICDIFFNEVWWLYK